MLPFKRLHQNIQRAVETTLIAGGYVDIFNEYTPVAIRGDKNYCWYMKPQYNMRAFAILVDLKADPNKTTFKPIFHVGETGGQYAETAVDRDKNKRALEKDYAVIRGYLTVPPGSHRWQVIDPEVAFHPSQTPKDLPKVELSARDRQILFVFGTMKNNGLRKEALSRLDARRPEIDLLISKGVLKMTGAGPAMTLVGEVNRLPLNGPLVPDQW
jgi:hypothetical protein